MSNRVPLSRIRARILSRIRWPESNRHFVQTICDIADGRDGWFRYGHLFVADEAGWIAETDWHDTGSLSNASAVSQRVRRALIQYERGEIQTTYRLFEFRRGGGECRAVTSYGHNFLNDSASFIQNQLVQSSICSSLATLAHIDELVPAGLRLLLRRESKKVRSISNRKKRQAHTSPPSPPQRNTQPTFQPRSENAKSAVNLVKKLGVRVAPTFTMVSGACSCRLGANCPRPAKHPILRRWQQSATRNEGVVCEWFDQKFVPSNVAIITGDRLSDGRFLVVLDVDRRSFGAGSLAVLKDEFEFPPTFTVRTADGIHYYYGTNNRLSNCKFAQGIDLQGAGGYVLAPGSHHASGAIYAVEHDLPIATLPDELVDLISYRFQQIAEEIPEGERHSRLRACSFAMACQGEPVERILVVLRRMLNSCASSESRVINDDELAALATSAVAKVARAQVMVGKIIA